MGIDPHAVTREFEAALCQYTGAPFAVAVTSCTMALLLAVRWCLRLAAIKNLVIAMTPGATYSVHQWQ